jgi:hypothetical protein
MLYNYTHNKDTEDRLEEKVTYVIDTLYRSADEALAEEAEVYQLHYKNNLDIEAWEEEAVDWIGDYRNILDIPM